MNYYTVRIELHNAALVHYTTLHAAMVSAGFSRTVRGSNGIEYHLPQAEYVIQGNYALNNIVNSGKAAIAKTGLSGIVFATQATSLQWDGLTQVKK